MQIENDLVVKLGADGEVVFEEPGLNDWAIMLAMDKKPLEEQADILLAKLKDVRGLTYKDGSAVTIKDLRAKKFSARFFVLLLNGWTKGIIDSVKSEAEEKNAGSTSA